MKQDPVGIILGEAMDKAVGATIRSWPYVLAICAVHAVTVQFPATGLGLGAAAVAFLLAPVQAFIGLRALLPDLRFATPWIVRFYVASALLSAVWLGLVFLPITAIALAARQPNISSWAALIPFVFLIGFGLAIWLGVKLSLAPTITVYEERPVGESIARAWRLTTGSFGQTFVFNTAVTLVVAILYVLPQQLGTYASLAYVHDPSTRALVDKLVEIALVPAMVYGNVACYVGYARFLTSLEAQAEGRIVGATKARTPAT
ncbi:MAG TPA: hypothetical protein VID24_03300 [Candidatus Eremiobacteraceae bacterium]|jgi:hypothetical protein